ncbi:aminodeoxychorismate synthase component I [Telmatobacter bradus]|uniref:aminodeoxychorismate synthase component I n=1 Tax=Telmatobacter bradus TaxID=474953 RepID=UPI003B42CEB1
MQQGSSLPAEIYTLVEQAPASVLLESTPRPSSTPRNADAFLFLDPLRTLEARTAEELKTLLQTLDEAAAAGLYAAGFFSYECGFLLEPKAGKIESEEPLAWFGLYDRCHRFDPALGGFVDGEPAQLAAMRKQQPSSGEEIHAEFALPQPQYEPKIEAIHKWIRSGDVYQLNFTAPFRVEAPGSLAELYRRLRQRQPAEYSAFVHWRPGKHILSLSPELFFRMEECDGKRRIMTKPMKGTVARGRTTAEDRAQTAWLNADEKNRAENLMIVDLLRNDLGRLARFGSVQVEELFAVERHPTLWQMTSTVAAEVQPQTSLYEVFQALFPSGSITGAPKVRAMQLLRQLEDGPRGVYTGSIGCVTPGKLGAQAVFNVAIRTLQMEGQQGRMGVGGGIVIDSQPASEYAECLLKAKFLTQQPPEFELLESLLWQPSDQQEKNYPRLALHMERLVDSANYFSFSLDQAEVEAALLKHAHGFTDNPPRKVRLTLRRDGSFAITSEPIAPSTGKTVCLARERTDSADVFLFHKTTHRPRYNRLFAEAARQGFADVLFLNERGELTEGAISNVFLVLDGQWVTPPTACGLLNGVERRALLAAQPEVEERVLTADDLHRAQAIYLTNAVRGLRPVLLQIDCFSK